ncbi:MAG TPA: helix-turn-helix transcriptional regulator [Methylomirabilota bacterium]|jgi:DNA-binding XRE family transcriptional regulator|nr:helix-turn-helix transcriptional regulator [Methylomirabilota bacterium]
MPNRATDRIAKDDEVILRRAEYDELIRRLEDLEDRGTVERVKKEKSRRYVPVEVVRRLISGEESKVKVWREHRGLTLRALAEKAEIAPAYLSEIETGKKPGSVKALAALARTLDVQIEALIDHED